MDTPSTHPRVLLLAQSGAGDDAILSQIAGDAQVRVVDSLEDAFALLRKEDFDLVVSRQSDFMELDRVIVDRQASTILDTLGQGVCMVELDGGLIWANPRMRGFPDEVTTQVCKGCVRLIGSSLEHEKGKPAYHRARRMSLTTEDDQHFEVTLTPVVDGNDDVIQIAAVVWDVTHTRRLQKKFDAIDLAGRELVQLDAETISSTMSVDERVALLEEKMVRYLHDLLNYDNFAVLLTDKKTNRLEVVIQHGMAEASRNIDIFATPENNGISGYVASTGRSYICHDTTKDPRYIAGLEESRSSLTVPLRLQDRVIGILNVESTQAAAFNEDDRQFVEILARYMAMTLNILDLLIVERYESTGRLADDVSGEIAGPLNDIITEASRLMEEYIGNDDLRHHLNAICDRVTEIKQVVKEVATPASGILGRHAAKTAEVDPVLNGKRILVADDDEIIRETISGVLRRSGCEVETAVDGGRAVAMLEQRSYDLVLADIKMPYKDGYEVFATAHDSNPNLPVILMTGFGYDPSHSIVRARKEGLGTVLFKPFKVDQLLSELRDALQSKT